MADQVNPLGSLTAGALQTLQVAAKPPSSKSPKSSEKAAESQAKEPASRPLGVSEQQLGEAAEEIQEFLKTTQSDLHFSVDKDTGGVVFKIINASTREVIRQVPSEEVLAMARKLRQLSHASEASGVLMDEKG
jgi:flagellar protein FlaG